MQKTEAIHKGSPLLRVVIVNDDYCPTIRLLPVISGVTGVRACGAVIGLLFGLGLHFRRLDFFRCGGVHRWSRDGNASVTAASNDAKGEHGNESNG
jgi:hypothetical protein